MIVHRYDPFRSLSAFDALFRDVFARSMASENTGSAHAPRARLVADDAGYVLTAELPGIAPEDIHIDATSDGITLRAERKVETPEGYENLRGEREGFTVVRRWTFPEEVDVDAVAASVDNGLLTVKLPLAEKLQPRRIEVRS